MPFMSNLRMNNIFGGAYDRPGMNLDEISNILQRAQAYHGGNPSANFISPGGGALHGIAQMALNPQVDPNTPGNNLPMNVNIDRASYMGGPSQAFAAGILEPAEKSKEFLIAKAKGQAPIAEKAREFNAKLEQQGEQFGQRQDVRWGELANKENRTNIYKYTKENPTHRMIAGKDGHTYSYNPANDSLKDMGETGMSQQDLIDAQSQARQDAIRERGAQTRQTQSERSAQRMKEIGATGEQSLAAIAARAAAR